LKGDILAIQGKNADARAAYQLALAKLDAAQKAADSQRGRDSGYRNSLQVKADALGEK
jgi:predicted negative regulator of RcsB-dependent stress response